MHLLIKQVEQHVKSLFEGEGTGHDWWHIHRVRNNAIHIAKAEKGTLIKLSLVPYCTILRITNFIEMILRLVQRLRFKFSKDLVLQILCNKKWRNWCVK